MKQGLVDELIVYIAPKLLGHEARGLMQLGELESLDESIECSIKDVRQIGEDLKITYSPKVK